MRTDRAEIEKQGISMCLPRNRVAITGCRSGFLSDLQSRDGLDIAEDTMTGKAATG
jgi:hypothetical protein